MAQAREETWIHQETSELEGTAEWRSEIAEEHPDDYRNVEASELCSHLAKELRELEGTPKAHVFELTYGSIFTSGADTYRIIEEWMRYRKNIGFQRSQAASDYLDALIRIARERGYPTLP